MSFDNTTKKWNYIDLIRDMDDRYGRKLVKLMDVCNKTNLCEITYEEAKGYYEYLMKGRKL